MPNMLTTVLALLIVTAVLSPSTSFAAVKTPPKLTNDAIIARQLPSSPVYGDVYPHGLYYVSMTIGDPVKPYFLDVDTGSDLTWLQCDAPCVSCSKCLWSLSLCTTTIVFVTLSHFKIHKQTRDEDLHRRGQSWEFWKVQMEEFESVKNGKKRRFELMDVTKAMVVRADAHLERMW